MKHTLKFCQDFATQRSGKCLSSLYDRKTKMEWECEHGHKWEALWGNIFHKNSWCPFCAGHHVSIEELQKIATMKEGVCLSEKYINARSFLLFRCKYGHEFQTTANRVKNGRWCSNPECIRKSIINAKKKYTIEDMHKLASSRGGECLSGIYVSGDEHLSWKCNCGRIWDARPYNVLHGQWCPDCGRMRRDDKIKAKSFKKLKHVCDINEYMITGKYHGTHKIVALKCKFNHTWEPYPTNIIRGNGCPFCSRYISQEKCRYILWVLTEEKWIITNKIVSPYQLDMYSDKWKVAFEHQGQQHYNEKCFGKTNLSEIASRDGIKNKMCAIQGVLLFRIPYWISRNDDEVVNYIKKCLKSANIDTKTSKVDLKNFYKTYSHCQSELLKIRNIAEKHGGECLSDCYINSSTKLEFQCNKEHQWSAAPSKIKAGRWCPDCKREKISISQLDADGLIKMQKIAEKRGGECLSHKYINCSTKLKFRCKLGHEWHACPQQIKGSRNKNGTWCPLCSDVQRRKRCTENSIKISQNGFPQKRKLDWERVKQLYLSGKSKRSIAKSMECNKRAIQYILKKLTDRSML